MSPAFPVSVTARSFSNSGSSGSIAPQKTPLLWWLSTGPL